MDLFQMSRLQGKLLVLCLSSAYLIVHTHMHRPSNMAYLAYYDPSILLFWASTIGLAVVLARNGLAVVDEREVLKHLAFNVVGIITLMLSVEASNHTLERVLELSCSGCIGSISFENKGLSFNVLSPCIGVFRDCGQAIQHCYKRASNWFVFFDSLNLASYLSSLSTEKEVVTSLFSDAVCNVKVSHYYLTPILWTQHVFLYVPVVFATACLLCTLFAVFNGIEVYTKAKWFDYTLLLSAPMGLSERVFDKTDKVSFVAFSLFVNIFASFLLLCTPMIERYLAFYYILGIRTCVSIIAHVMLQGKTVVCRCILVLLFHPQAELVSMLFIAALQGVYEEYCKPVGGVADDIPMVGQAEGAVDGALPMAGRGNPAPIPRNDLGQRRDNPAPIPRVGNNLPGRRAVGTDSNSACRSSAKACVVGTSERPSKPVQPGQMAKASSGSKSAAGSASGKRRRSEGVKLEGEAVIPPIDARTAKKARNR